MDSTFAALADPTRRAILKRLSKGAASMGELAEPFGMSWPAKPMREARAWIDDYQKFWEERFDALERYLEETAEDKPKRRS